MNIMIGSRYKNQNSEIVELGGDEKEQGSYFTESPGQVENGRADSMRRRTLRTEEPLSHHTQ